MASFGSKLVRESVFVSELEQEFTSRLGLSCSESSLSPSVSSNLGLWLAGIGLHDYESLFLESGYDDIDFVVSIFTQVFFLPILHNGTQRCAHYYLAAEMGMVVVPPLIRKEFSKYFLGNKLQLAIAHL